MFKFFDRNIFYYGLLGCFFYIVFNFRFEQILDLLISVFIGVAVGKLSEFFSIKISKQFTLVQSVISSILLGFAILVIVLLLAGYEFSTILNDIKTYSIILIPIIPVFTYKGYVSERRAMGKLNDTKMKLMEEDKQ